MMNIRVVTLGYSETLGGFPEEPLRQVLGEACGGRAGVLLHPRRRAPSDAGMDDLVLERQQGLASGAGRRSGGHVATTRSLELKAERTLVAPCSVGVPFPGYRVFLGLIGHQGPRGPAPSAAFREREPAYCRGELTAEQLTAFARSMNGSRQFLHAGEALRSEIEL